MSTKTANQLLKGIALTPTDTARLVLECLECLGEFTQKQTRLETLSLVRKVLQLGRLALQAQENTVSFETAAWASVKARSDRRSTTQRDLRHYVRRMLRVGSIGNQPIRSMNTQVCRHILQTAFGSSSSSYKKGRAILHSIFAYGIRQEWCDNNPVSRIEVPKVHEQPISPLKPEQVERLKKTVKMPQFQDMQFSLSLLLYSGMRPTEVSRLKEEDFCWEEHQIIVRPHTSKTGGGRTVSLRGIRGICAENRIIPRNWKRKWQALRRSAGFRQWIPDICRHTFASYHASYFRNLSELQLEMGHRDVSLLRSRYMTPTLRKDAASFWKNAG